MPEYIEKPPFTLRNWTRNAAFTPTELALLNVKCHEAVQRAIVIFTEDIAVMNLDDAQRAEALAIFSERMGAAVDELVETVQQACSRRTDY